MLKPFFIRQNKVLKKIQPEDVIGLSTVGNYTRIFLKNKTYYMVRSTLSNAITKLPPDMFFKIHRRVVVNVYYIDVIQKDHLVIDGESLPIGRLYYPSLINKLKIIE